MKNKFFEFIEIDKNILKNFCDRHVEMFNFIDPSAPFYVRIGKKLYATLIHTIISVEEDDDIVNIRLTVFARDLKNKIDPKKINKMDFQRMKDILGDKKAELVKTITSDVISKKLDLKELSRSSEQTIFEKLAAYPNITINIIKQFAIFGCFKQNILCYEEKEFIEGMKIFLNKKEITEEDIKNVSQKYSGQLTIFTLCMFRINNENGRK